jgi:uncharacterized protein (DUF58 family)
MAIRGRVALVAVGALPVVLLGGGWVLAAWLGFCVAVAAVDLLLAAGPRAVLVERVVPERMRLDETADTVLAITNRGRRTMNALVRDAWDPSAGLLRPRARVRVPAGERRALGSAIRPLRRGERTT